MRRQGQSQPYDSPEVKNLILRAKKGDEAAFTQLVRVFEDLVYKYAFKLCRDQERAEETFQDTFVNVFKHLKQFDGRSKFSSWLYTIVSNNCLMKLRKSKLEKASVRITDDADEHDLRHGAEGVPLWKETPLDGVLRGEIRNALGQAISKLPAAYRAVFLLRDVEERSARETAKILGLSVAAVKSRLHRARSFLRDELNPYMTQ